MTPRARCRHPKDGGDECTVYFGLCKECGCCWHHCEHKKKERERARSRGGKTTAAKRRKARIRTVEASEAPAPPETLEDAVRWASWATFAVATGEIDARTAHEIGYLVRALKDGLKELEVADEVEKLAATVERLKARSTEATS